MVAPDFSGWATKANLRCSDGRVITPEAFKHMDGQRVPLVWMHKHDTPDAVLGYAELKHVDGEGTRADCYFNETPAGQNVKAQVKHGDLKFLSIWANQLQERAKSVLHGMIREVSLVLAGANPGAMIDQINLAHGDYSEELDEAIITTGIEIFHMDEAQANASATVADPQDVSQIWDSFTPEQQSFVNSVVDFAVEDAKNAPADPPADPAPTDTPPAQGDISHQEGAGAVTRVFDQTDQLNGTSPNANKRILTAEEKNSIFHSAMQPGATLRSAVNDFCLQHGITPMDVLFPNFQNLDATPQFNTRRMEWVAGVLNGVSHTPFSRVRSIVADITQDDARAKGYITGNYKKEEWFTVTKRTTSPTTIYKKQKLDRDDIIDITDFDVVAWVRAEMDLMLREELACAILFGDGRDIEDEDKILDPSGATSGDGIRSIMNEHELYKTDINVNLTSTPNYETLVEEVMQGMRWYKGTGSPVFYTTLPVLAQLLLIKDGYGRRMYTSKADVAAAMMVDDIIPCEAMERETANGLLGIVVNLSDYSIGADKGGEVNLFDFFDIDYNQYKYMIETRLSGALRKIKSALVVWSVPTADVLVTPTVPTFDKSTGIVTVPTKTGVVYKNDSGTTLTAGAQTAITAGNSLTVIATPTSGYYFSTAGSTTQWTFALPPAPTGRDAS
jgi:hypothetical protein